ncbi:hydrogenase maturation protein [Nitrosomonas sp.]|uniref:hydrogenase maturation protein n=1 Tax=Nitrosomonas sp. TaxID=42353 RepID=UPI001E13CB03|nr:hydrogenase maturation protein [Nitrosomonas sp.]MBX3615897.1 hydrogenase maturation protein [Nitrosomonas sp.]
MKILILTHSFNCLTQRLFVELKRCGYDLSIEFDINDAVTCEAVELFQPDLIIAPYLKRRIPEKIWRTRTCFIVHPGIVGDRGPSALDWAIMQGLPQWGVTILQANAEMDAGDIWATEVFPMRFSKKSSLYRHEVVETATRAVLTAISRLKSETYHPMPLDYTRPDVQGRLHTPMRQVDRCIDWQRDNTFTILRKIHAADGFPGVLDWLFEEPCYLFDAHSEKYLSGKPGAIVAKRNNAICRATIDGAIWIGHVKRRSDNESTFKLAATRALKNHLTDIPEISIDPNSGATTDTYQEIWFEKKHQVGYLHFAFYNGAMDSGQCEQLRDAYLKAISSDIRVIVLMGGPDFWSNGIHLNHIECADSPADESWRNINAMNDLVHAIITTDRQLTIAALQGNAGAGGVFLSLAADYIYANTSVILNPHYKSMGNLYGSEYWTYLLPRKVDTVRVQTLTQNRLPIGAQEARDIGLIDDCFALSPEDFRTKIAAIAETLATSQDFTSHLQRKIQRRLWEERLKPLQCYRDEELQRMQLNFYGFDPSYHVARYHFVHKIPYGWTPRYLARHRSH